MIRYQIAVWFFCTITLLGCFKLGEIIYYVFAYITDKYKEINK